MRRWVQFFLAAGALGGALLLRAPTFATILIALACLGPLRVAAGDTGRRANIQKASFWTAWAASAMAWVQLLATPDPWYAPVCLALAGLHGLAAARCLGVGWWTLGLGWSGASAGILLTAGYLQNEAGVFYLGWFLLALTLAAALVLVRMPFRLAQGGLGLLLFVLLLPAVDHLLRPRFANQIRPAQKLYSFAVSGQDPAAFERWWNYYRDQWDMMGGQVFRPDPEGKFPFRLREGARGTLAESEIRINQLGFRGEDFPRDKGNAFRIVALGESTTFGCTLEPGDRPWPEVLADLIRLRLKTARPVEVINAGVPAYTVVHNVERLVSEILPLQPDVIISYHGYNGFRMLDSAVPPAHGLRPPSYPKRPLKLLADAEHRLRLAAWKRRSATPPPKPAARENPLATPYAEAYRRLIALCEQHGVQLALATFSMAVNPASPPEVVDFYRRGFPSVHAQIQANHVHTQIARTLAAEHPRVLLVDTQPLLDGRQEQFIDLIHLTQEGRNTLAEALFQGLRPVLPTGD